eukprot:COSAG02_NODE_42167_length_387_cov_0.715278_1_plen_27_part_01
MQYENRSIEFTAVSPEPLLVCHVGAIF